MAVSFELPLEIEKSLRQEVGDLGQAAKGALLVELYRQEKLTHHELGTALGLSPMETDGVLKKHEVYLEMTADDVIAESEGLRKLRGQHADHR